eukprot:2289783-Rhodomonas_salina.1
MQGRREGGAEAEEAEEKQHKRKETERQGLGRQAGVGRRRRGAGERPGVDERGRRGGPGGAHAALQGRAKSCAGRRDAELRARCPRALAAGTMQGRRTFSRIGHVPSAGLLAPARRRTANEHDEVAPSILLGLQRACFKQLRGSLRIPAVAEEVSGRFRLRLQPCEQASGMHQVSYRRANL